MSNKQPISTFLGIAAAAAAAVGYSAASRGDNRFWSRGMKVFAAATGVMLWSVLAGTARADIFTNSDGFGMDPVITFDEFGAGPVDGTEWQPEFGITFAGLTLEVNDLDPFPGIDGLNLLGFGFDVIIQFDVPIDAFAMAWVTNPGTTTFSLFLNNVPVEEATVATDFDDPSIAFSVFENVTFDRIDAHINANLQAFRTDNLQFTIVPTADRTLIIKQGACPAPVNPGSNGVTPMLLVGDTDFDVNDVVVASLELTRCDGVGGAVSPLNGPPGPGSQVVDLNHPNDDDVGCGEGQVPCACNPTQSSDGIDDLKLKFRTSEMAAAFELDAAPTGTPITLFLTGELSDGSTFAAADCIRLVGPPAPLGILAVESNLTDVWIEATPLDGILDGGGFTPFTRSWPDVTFVTLSAPMTLPQGWTFAGWSGDFTPLGPTDKPQVDVMLWGPASIEAIYNPPDPPVGKPRPRTIQALRNTLKNASE